MVTVKTHLILSQIKLQEILLVFFMPGDIKFDAGKLYAGVAR